MTDSSSAERTEPQDPAQEVLATVQFDPNVTLEFAGASGNAILNAPTLDSPGIDRRRADRRSTTFSKRILGDYELLSELGRGGMGVVYRARQRSLNRPVAVKMVISQSGETDSSSSDEVLRFQLEAEAAANLRHPGIVAIYDVGQVDGCHFYSMEYIEGHDLAKLVAEHSLAAEQAAKHLVQLAEAMQYAHEHGILHRDLKPSNVLLDGNGQLKIMDFGLAKRFNADSQLTGAGAIIGTPSYMPPEQAWPSRGPVGPHSDVYSLGAILYELLTCRPPFRGESPLETIRQLLAVEPVAPRLLNPRVPPDLETICLKCLEKEPDRRYGSARLLADELQRFLRGEPILARPLGRVQRLARWCRRNPFEASLIGGIAATLLLGIAGVTWQWRKAQHHLDRANANFELLGSASDQMLQVASDLVTRVPPRGGAPHAGLEGTLKLYDQFLREEPTNTAARVKLAETHHRVADIRRNLGQWTLAAEQYQRAITEYQRLAAEQPDDVEWRQRAADEQDWLGESYRQADQIDQAMGAFAEAMTVQESLLASAATPALRGELARTLSNRGLARYEAGDTAAAQTDFERSIELLRVAHAEQPAEPIFRRALAWSRINLGLAHKNRQELKAAHQEYRAAIELLAGLVREFPQRDAYRADLAKAHLNRGNLLLVHRQQPLLESGDALAESQVAFQESIRLLSDLAREFPSVLEYRALLANSFNGLGGAQQVAKQDAEARASLERARDEFLALLRDGGEQANVRSDLGLAFANLALLVPRDRQRDKIALLEQAVANQAAAIAADPSSTSFPSFLRNHRLSLARALLQIQDHPAAIRHLDELVANGFVPARDWKAIADLFVRAMAATNADAEVREACGARAVATVQRAIHAGVVDFTTVAMTESLKPIHARADFQRMGDARK